MYFLPTCLVGVFLALINQAKSVGFCPETQLPRTYESWPGAQPWDAPWESYQDVRELCIGPSYGVANFACCTSGNGVTNCQVPQAWQSDLPRANQLKSICSQCSCQTPEQPSALVDEPFDQQWDADVLLSVKKALSREEGIFKQAGISCVKGLNLCKKPEDCNTMPQVDGCGSQVCSAFGRRSARRPTARPRPRPRPYVGRCVPRDLFSYIKKQGPGGGFGGAGMGGGLLGKRGLQELIFTGACHCNETVIHEDCCDSPTGMI